MKLTKTLFSKKQRKFILTFIACFMTFSLLSQANYSVNILLKDSSNIRFKQNLKVKDSINATKYIAKKIIHLQKKGYLLASVDSSYFNKNEAFYTLYIGSKFQNAHLNIDPDDIHYLKKKARLSEKYLANIAFNAKEVTRIKQTIHQPLENNGYPFAAVELDSLTFKDDEINANLVIKKNQRMKWRKITIIGDEKISKKLICSYIQIKEGEWFNQELLNLISNRISLLPFVEEEKPAEILFTPWGVELYLYLRSKKVSSADGIIGLQPKIGGKGYYLTGELKLKLVNQLKLAESFDLQWKSIQKQTQSLDINVNLPNLFNTRFGFDGSFHLYKRDTTFMDIKFQLGVQYALNNGSYAKFYYQNENSSILRSGLNNASFSNLNNSKTSFYGLALVKQTINYLPNPSKGYIINADIAIGLRKTKHPDSTDFLKSTTYRLQFNYLHFVTLYRRNVLKIGVTGNYLIAPNYFENEVFRFGGQFIQRGFNEEQLYATIFGTATVEYRFLVDKNSYAFAFYDQSAYQNATLNNFTDYPFGFGVGFTYGTKIGSFSISYALGKQKNNDISFKDGKIHFGYIAYF